MVTIGLDSQTGEPMDDLSATIDVVRARIEEHRGKNIGEQNTKAVLINPVLRTLGWNLEDLDEVVLEYKRKSMDNPVDYAFMLQRTPRLFIEAKPLDGNLSDPKWAGQIMAYATVAGVQWVALTDGNEYQIYNAHAPVPVEQKLLRSTRLADGMDVGEVLQLLSKERMQQGLIASMWKAHFVDQQVQTAMRTLISPEPSPGIVRLIRKHAPSLQPAEIRDGLARMEVRFDFPSPPGVKPIASVGPLPKTDFGAKSSQVGTPWRNVTMTDLVGEGLISPPTDLRKAYKGVSLSGRIESDGQVSFGGTRYESLSMAAAMARRTVIGAPEGRPYPQTNGWTFWHFQDTDGSWKELDVLRQRLWKQRQG